MRVAVAQADQPAGNRASDDGLLLLDVNPLSLSIQTMGGLAEKIVPRNSTVPVARRRTSPPSRMARPR